jgi:hypothetical protein
MAFVACGLLTLGCSSQNKLIPVSGQVTMNGRPLGNVRVDFHPDPDKGTRGTGSSGTTDAEGKFMLTVAPNQPGAVAGHHRVILEDLDIYGSVLVGKGDYRNEDKGGGVREVAKKPRFAEIYRDLGKTPLRQEVTPGMAPVNIVVTR